MDMSLHAFASRLLRRGERRGASESRKPIIAPRAMEALEGRRMMSAASHHHHGGHLRAVQQTNLVSDQPGVAQLRDPNLVNPWGISQGPGPLWLSDNGTGVSTLHNGQGQEVNPLNPNGPPLVVNIPAPGDPTGHGGTPTGTVFNPTFLGNNPGFSVSDGTNTAPSIFLFATEDGTIVGWNPGVNPRGSDPASAGTFGTIAVDNSAAGAIYKGLAIGTDANGRTLLYAADFHGGKIDVFDTKFRPVTDLPAGAFTDPYLPSGYAPFNVQALGGKIYVTYAKQDAAKKDPVDGHGHGFVDVFNLDGSPGLSGNRSRLVSRGPLDSPWGVSLAPDSFGDLSGDVLVGNFGNGRVNVFDPTTGRFVTELRNSRGRPIQIDGLWALQTGNGFAGTDPNTIYFTAGPGDEQHGLFGTLTAGAME
jgi:uncharacterized protein (TIGR03118 family)